MRRGCYTDIDLDKMSGKIGAMVYHATRQISIDVFNYAVRLSPVDTGAFRASWTINEGSPVYHFVGRQPKGTVLPPPSANIAAISTKFYRKIYVTNGAPYASLIEHSGWSSQAPSGVLKPAIMFAEMKFKSSNLPKLDSK